MGSGCDDNVFPRRCLWKMLVLEEDGLALFERQAAGGGGKGRGGGVVMLWYSSRGLLRGLKAVLCLAGGRCGESRLCSSAGEAGKWQATSSTRHLKPCRCIYEQGQEGRSDQTNYQSVNNRCLTLHFAIVQKDARIFFISNADPDTTMQLFF